MPSCNVIGFDIWHGGRATVRYMDSNGLGGFAKSLKLNLDAASGKRVVMTCDVTPEFHQPYGIVHGGFYCALVETAASVGANLWLEVPAKVVGMSNTTDFLHAVREGTLRAVAEPVHQTREIQLWEVKIDDGMREVARGKVHFQNLLEEAWSDPHDRRL